MTSQEKKEIATRILREYERVGWEKGWKAGGFARDAKGKFVRAENPNAVCACIVNTGRRLGIDPEDTATALDYRDATCLAWWNDSQHTYHPIKGLLEKVANA